ncbi:MAG TPA: IclR family transcriptional regulator [Xanthobacteraceae bacterium]|nr:IclR family transcriptional regulator [Xanthobacteraceae bacterium]
MSGRQAKNTAMPAPAAAERSVAELRQFKPPPGTSSEGGERYIVPGLKRGLTILQLFGDDGRILRLAEIARQLEVPRSSAFRLVYTLENLGFVERTKDGYGYRLGSRVLSLGFAYLSSTEIVNVAREPLNELNRRTGLGVNLAVREGTEIVHLIRVLSRGPFTSNLQVGQRRPAHAAPMGRVLLCELPDAELTALYGAERTLRRYTVDTPTTLDQLRRVLARDRARGYVISLGTFVPSGCSICAPVRDASGKIVAAINMSGARDPALEKQLGGKLKDELLATAAEISSSLGYAAALQRSRKSKDQ